MQSRDAENKPVYEQRTVAVDGGDLLVARWGSEGPVILAIHGITASHREFVALAEALPQPCQLVAPDLRGRGGSRSIRGPWGMEAHARDMVALLDALGLPRADVVLGHSMGGFVAAVMAARYPTRCGELLLVDGGLAIMPPIAFHRLPWVGDWIIRKLVHKVLGPALERLQMTFESDQAYRDYWRQHPALCDDWSAYIEDYLDYDLYGEPPALRPSTNEEALLQDVRTQLFEDIVPVALQQVPGPVRFLRAPRGLMNEKALYSPQRVAKGSKGVAGFSCTDIDNTNHYTILLSAHGAAAVAGEITALLGRQSGLTQPGRD